jgi:hypothetical protein
MIRHSSPIHWHTNVNRAWTFFGSLALNVNVYTPELIAMAPNRRTSAKSILPLGFFFEERLEVLADLRRRVADLVQQGWQKDGGRGVELQNVGGLAGLESRVPRLKEIEDFVFQIHGGRLQSGVRAALTGDGTGRPRVRAG